MLGTVVGSDLFLKQLRPSSIDDLRGGSVSFVRSGGAVLGARSGARLLDELRPLLFVTAWKVLDLIVELVREISTGMTPPPRGWRIRDKVTFVRTQPGVLTEPFVSYPAFWQRLARLYARLEEPRNAVVHRQFRRSSASGLIPYSVNRRPLRTITPDEIDALAAASSGLAEEVVTGRADRRRCAAIASALDDLRGITRLTQVGASSPPSLRVVQLRLEASGRRWRLDLRRIREHLATQSAADGFADIEAYLPGDTAVYRGRLDDAPEADSVEFAASRPPSWLRRR
jgi:hypothetical protein